MPGAAKSHYSRVFASEEPRCKTLCKTDSTELLRTLIRNACVNDGDVASGQKVRNVDALEARAGVRARPARW